MRIIFYRNKSGNSDDIGERIGDMTVKGTIDSNRKGFLSLIDVNAAEFAKEYLGAERILQTGIRSIRSCGDFWSNFYVQKGVNKDIISNHMRETIISAGPNDGGVEESHFEWTATPVVTENGQSDLILGVEVFDTGFIVGSSANVTNIIGGRSKAYFNKITSKNFKQSDRSGAKVFKDEKALLKYMNDKKDIFLYIASHSGYEFHYEPVSRMYVEERKKPMEGEVFDKLDAIFAEINGAEETEPTFACGNTPEEEAFIRMKEMDLWLPVRNDFKKSGKIYMSEFGGAVYDLNEEAEKAVREASEYGLPYHVVRSQTSLGDMYAVLFVSKWSEEWNTEHRDPRTGEIVACVHNATHGITEIGSITVEKANGGLSRTA